MDPERLGVRDSDFVRGGLAIGIAILAIIVLFPGIGYKGGLVNNKKTFELSWSHAKRRFQSGARELITAAFNQNDGKHKDAFYMVTDNGVEMIIHPKYANEIRNDERFSISAYNEQSFHGRIPGFEMFKENIVEEQLFINAVRSRLTRSLGKLLGPISEEVTSALRQHWTDKWHRISLHSTVLPVIAQQSSRVFLGEELCHNADWLRITVNHTVSFFMAVEALRVWPKILRPLAAKFSPMCKNLRAEIEEARRIITPILENRRAQRQAHSKYAASTKPDDLIEWLEETADGRSYDAAGAQLKISVAAIHTTSDLLTQTLFNIADNPALIRDLRRETMSTVGTHGWKKATLYNMKLMDSVLKETQRLKPISIGTMVRVTLDDVTLSDGLRVPRGTKTLVSCHNMWDKGVYDNADQFDGYRFYELRKLPGQENSSQLVSTSPNHFAFGHGLHACPGRFFAAAEVKITLCHILLKYDIRLVGERPNVIEHGVAQYANAWGQIEIKRREEEIAL
ncbi:uncharacterized protein N7496_002397 [Penicillium cataractarum]|uniref:Cytochrome P450 n=1 Tax=Penicillium cataractarum TaxID=2100454 RepID=A0A9W9SMG5_9EURO|nr:uncharacterized protein N7496_002397 [Penicillium cataractarum]KAJ5379969.1 hypothetical protein N7496_002397 [Penicillium cataractarum]